LRQITGHARLDARTPGLEFLGLYLGDPPRLRLTGGSGSVHVDGQIKDGRVMPETEALAVSDHLTIGAAGFAVALDYRASLRVENASPEPLASGDFVVHRATIHRDGADGASPRLEDARAHFTGLPRDLAGPVEITRTDLDIPAVFPELRWLLPARESDEARLVDLGGSGAARARVTVDRAMRAAGTVEASAHGLDVKAPSIEVEVEIGAEVATTIGFHDADFARKHVVFDPGFVVAEQVVVTRAKHAHAGGTLRVDVTEGRLDDGVPRDFALAVAAKTPDLGWLAWKNPKGGDPRLAARTASLNARLRVPYPASLLDGTAEEAAISGSLGLAGTGDMRFKGTLLRGDVEATGSLQRLDLGRGVIALRDLHAVTRDLTVYGGASPTPGWWGRFDVSRLDVDTSAAMTMDLRGEARCKDGLPFNAILASYGVFPGWVGDLFPMEGLTASAGIRRAHEKLDLAVTARGSSANVTVRLHGVGKAMTGAVKVDTNLVSLGVGFTDGKSDVKVFAGEEWLSARIAEASEREAADQGTTPAPQPASR
jgi:hypothetical protein